MKQKNIQRIVQVLAILFLPAVFFLLSMLPVLVCLIAGILFFASFIRIKKLGVTQWLIALFQGAILVSAMIGISAPFRALTLLMWRMTNYPMGQMRDFSWSGLQFLRNVWPNLPTDIILAWAGAITFFILGLHSFIAFEKQSRQFRNLPTSDVSSVSIGLAELRGRARLAESPRFRTEVNSTAGRIPGGHILYYRRYQDGDQERQINYWSTFYLEDRTGRILVDPRGVEFWYGSWGLYESLSKIWIKRRYKQAISMQGLSEERSLREGDPVSVIGSVEIDSDALPDAAGTDRLVIRPSTEKRQRGLLERLFYFGDFMKKIGRGREYRHVFILADAEEEEIAEALNRSKLQTIGWAGVFLGLSILLGLIRL